MLINSELDLVGKFLNNYSKIENIKIITELETNFGRPDIVILTINKDRLKARRKNYNNEFFLRKYSYILSFLFFKSWVSLSKINRFFNFSDSELKRALISLEKMNLIDIRGELIKSKPANQILVVSRIRVIEAKLSNWKYVIEQAERHLWFTKESSILLPGLSENVIKRSSQACKRKGIGLFTFNGNKKVELVKPSSTGLINTPLLWELNEKIVKGEIN